MKKDKDMLAVLIDEIQKTEDNLLKIINEAQDFCRYVNFLKDIVENVYIPCEIDHEFAESLRDMKISLSSLAKMKERTQKLLDTNQNLKGQDLDNYMNNWEDCFKNTNKRIKDAKIIPQVMDEFYFKNAKLISDYHDGNGFSSDEDDYGTIS